MIVTPTVTPLGDGIARLAWSGLAGATVRVFVRGLLAVGPVAMADADKQVDVALPDPCTIEVHENDATETVPAASIALERKPLLWWSSVANAAEYRVYFDNTLLAVVPHESWRLHHEHQLEQDVRQDGAVWVGFRITAVTASGLESDTLDTPFFAPGAPLEPTDLDVTGGGGSFNINLVVP